MGPILACIFMGAILCGVVAGWMTAEKGNKKSREKALSQKFIVDTSKPPIGPPLRTDYPKVNEIMSNRWYTYLEEYGKGNNGYGRQSPKTAKAPKKLRRTLW